MPSRLLALPVLLGVALLAGAACAAPAPAPGPAPAATPASTASPGPRQPSGTLTVGLPRPSNPAIDPGEIRTSESAFTSWPIFDGLTLVDDKGVLRPALAESWSSPDGRIWDFRLRQDIQFSNGEPFNAAAVQFTLDHYLNPDNRLAIATQLANVERVETTGPFGVRFVLKEIDPSFPATVNQTLVLPPGAFRAAPSPAAFFERPAGTGPFRLVAGNPNDGFTYEAQPTTFVTPRGAPAVQRVVLRWVPEAAAREAGLRTGELDAIVNLPPDVAKALERDGFTISQSTSGPVVTLAIRQDEGPLADVRVRQAANYAVDRRTIVDSILGGFARIDEGQILGPQGFGYNPEVRGYPYDPGRARQLLAEAGQAAGFSATLSVIANPLAGPDMGVAVARYLTDAGIRTEVRTLEAAVWARISNAGQPAERGEFFVSLLSGEDPIQAYRFYSGSVPPFVRRWNNPDFDRLYQQARVTVDEAQRRQLFQQQARILRDQAANLFLWQPVNLGAARPGVTFDPGYSAVQFTQATVR